jgi:hypothetical protein
VYKALPKYICWKIWLARNRIIFSNLRSPPDLVAKKDVALLAEFFLSKPKLLSFTPNSTLESDWICSFFPYFPSTTPSPSPPPDPPGSFMMTLITCAGTMNIKLTLFISMELQRETSGWQEREGSSFAHEETKFSLSIGIWA